MHTNLGMFVFAAGLLLGCPPAQAGKDPEPIDSPPGKKINYSWHSYQDLWGDPTNPPRPKHHRRSKPDRKRDTEATEALSEAADSTRSGELSASEPLSGSPQSLQAPQAVATVEPQKTDGVLQPDLVVRTQAQGSEFPLEPLSRPLVLPPGLSEVRATLRVETPEDEDRGAGVQLEGRRGLTRGIDAGLSAPLMVQPDLQLGDLQADATFDLINASRRALALSMTLVTPVSAYTDWPLADFVFLGELRFRQSLYVDRLAFLVSSSVGGSLGDRSYLLLFVDLGLTLQLFHRVSLGVTAGAHSFIDRPNPVAVPLAGRLTAALTPLCDLVLEAGSADLLHTRDVRIDAGVAFRLW